MREFTNLTLNNGTIAEFKGIDFWSRPFYLITVGEGDAASKYTVCCTELNGTYLHYYCPRNDTDGEPDYPLPQPYQPKAMEQTDDNLQNHNHTP